jgi:hypothetical protein
MKSKLAIVCGLLLASATALAADDNMGSSSSRSGTGATGTGTTTGTTDNRAVTPSTGSSTNALPRSGSDTEGMGTSAFMSLDKDRDGRISRQEARPNNDVSNKFEDADANGDGFLSQTEHQSLTGIN